MKNSYVLKARRLKLLKLDYLTIILFTVLVCGVFLGISIMKNADEAFKNMLFNFFDNYLSAKSHSGILIVFSGVFVILALFVLFDFLFGLCAIGTPLIFFLLLLFGGFCGFCGSCVILNWGLKGLFYFLLVNLPCNAITAAILVKCCCESINMSVVLFSCILSRDRFSKNQCEFKEYVVKYLIFLIPVAIAGLLSALFFRIYCSLFVVL